jgi:hypothetical protein
MKIIEVIERFLPQAPAAGRLGSERCKLIASLLVARLLDQGARNENPILEASVHRSRRSLVWVATFAGPAGGQVWRTTGSTDYDRALMLARHWESQARAERAMLGRAARKPSLRVPRSELSTGVGPLTQKEVAQILKMTERGVREVERRAFRKLRHHPGLQQLWQRYLSGDLEEAGERLSPTEIQALWDVAGTPEELRVIEKVLRLIQP